MKKLCEIPNSKHPFNLDRFEKIMGELDRAENGFRNLQHHERHPQAESLGDEVIEARRAVLKLWDAMREVEEAEKMQPA